MKKTRNTFLLIGFIGILSVALIIFGAINVFQNKNKPSSSAVTAPSASSELPIIKGDAVSNDFSPETKPVDNTAKIGSLINTLPYSSADFSLDYDFNKNLFLVKFKTNNGSAAFEKFLISKGINRSSINISQP